MTNSSLVKKLKIKTGQLIAVINPPEGYIEELGSLPEGVDLSTRLEGRFDLVHLFVENSAQLGQLFPSAFQSLKEEGLLWIYYPKGSSKIKAISAAIKAGNQYPRQGYELCPWYRSMIPGQQFAFVKGNLHLLKKWLRLSMPDRKRRCGRSVVVLWK